MNLVMLAKPLLQGRGPIDTLQQLDELVTEVISEFNNWGKYTPSTLRSCPSLAATSDAVELQVILQADQISDLPDNFHKKVRVEEVKETGGSDQEARVRVNRVEVVKETETGTYRSYMKGMNQQTVWYYFSP